MRNFDEFLLDELENSYFDCLSQQICALCYKFHGEYWKLFLDENLYMDFDEVENDLSDALKIDYQYIEAPLKYYGIDLLEEKSNCNFIKGNIYLVSIDAEKYPLCKGLTNIDHYFIIYDMDEKNFVVHDAYYKNNKYFLNINEFRGVFNNVYRIDQFCKPIQTENIEYLDRTLQFRNLMYKLYDKIQEGYTFDMNQDIFYLRLKDIYSLKRRMIIILNNLIEDHDPMQFCNIILGKIIDKWRAIWYNLFKQYIKCGYVNQEKLNFKSIKNLIDVEFSVLSEIKSDFIIWRRLSNIFFENGLDEVTDRKIYDFYNGTSIIYFLNKIEEEFCIDLDPQCLLSSETLCELKNKVYIEVLEKRGF